LSRECTTWYTRGNWRPLTNKGPSFSETINGRREIFPSSAIILGGGKGRRMGGNKIYLALDGSLVVETVIKRLSGSFKKIIIAAGQNDVSSLETILGPLRQGTDIRVISDKNPGRGPLEGIASALELLDDKWAFVTGCDMPCIKDAVIRKMWNEQNKNSSVVCAKINGFVEPLHAFYHISCIEAARKRLSSGERKLKSFYEDVRVSVIEERSLKLLPGYKSSFKSMNTPEDIRSITDFCSL